MRNIILSALFFTTALISGQLAFADAVNPKQEISCSDFINKALSNNHRLKGEQYKIGIMEQKIETAKIFPDPSLSFDWTDSREKGKRVGYGANFELGTTVELGGKRSARVSLAQSESIAARSSYDDFFRAFRADAMLSYLDALKNLYLYQVKSNSYLTMAQLASADSVRHTLGGISEVDCAQSSLEAGLLLNETIQASAELRNSLIRLTLLAGMASQDTLLVPKGEFKDFNRNFVYNELLKTAINNRPDLKAIKQNIISANNALSLAEKNRIIDIDVKMGLSQAYSANSASPSGSDLTAGISIPLKFSNMYNGDLQSAQLQKLQEEESLNEALLSLEFEVSTAFESYSGLKQQLKNFENGLLERAKYVFEGKIYSYKRGETSLFEALNARRTYNETQITYYETLYKYAASIVELERTIAVWDF